jgi:hypothetical protein
MLLNGKGCCFRLPRRTFAEELGAWLLKQAREIRAAINSLTNDAAVDRDEIKNLSVLVNQLLVEAERSAKVQVAHGVELEQVRRAAEETQRQLNGVKISRGMHKAKAQKLLQDMQHRLN